jgi:Protein of unknown function (DUF4056)
MMAMAKISRGVLPGLFILLLIAAGAIFSHRTASAQTASGGVPPPGNRLCCAFGFAYGCDPAVLANPTAPKHNYGNQPDDQPLNSVPYAACHGSEPVGYVYTAAAGLVDVGHVRDNADMTFSVYNQLLKKQHSIATGGNSAGVVNIPTDSNQLIDLAGAITWVTSWAHELTTWGDTSAAASIGTHFDTRSGAPDTEAEDYSAFSPEDLSSNIVGIELAERAISNGGTSVVMFDHQVDVQLAKLLQELGAVSGDATTSLIAQVKFVPGGKSLDGKWWMDDPESVMNFTVRLLRRNFDGLAWKISGAPSAPTPSWLNTGRFSSYYPQFLYLVNIQRTSDATQVPRTSEYALEPPNSRILRWDKIAPGKIPTAATYQEGLGGSFSILGQDHKPLAAGLFSQVKVNTYTAQPLYILANMRDATDQIRAQFKASNQGMDGP